jgi:glutathione S-transferase
MERVAALGHGARSELSAQAALDEALASEPRPAEPGAVADGFSLGELVTVAPEEGTSPPVEGAIVRLTEEEVALRREHPRTGPVVVHFPRLRYVVRRR